MMLKPPSCEKWYVALPKVYVHRIVAPVTCALPTAIRPAFTSLVRAGHADEL